MGLVGLLFLDLWSMGHHSRTTLACNAIGDCEDVVPVQVSAAELVDIASLIIASNF